MKNNILTCIEDGFFFAGGPPAEAIHALSQADLILFEPGISHEWFWHIPSSASIRQIRLPEDAEKGHELLVRAEQTGQKTALLWQSPTFLTDHTVRVCQFPALQTRAIRWIPGIPVSLQLIRELHTNNFRSELVLLQKTEDFRNAHIRNAESTGYLFPLKNREDEFSSLRKKLSPQDEQRLLGMVWNSFWNCLFLFSLDEFSQNLDSFVSEPDVSCWLLSLPEGQPPPAKKDQHPPRLVITRKIDQAKELYLKLRDLGIRTLPFPTIDTHILEAFPPDELKQINQYRWLVFSSANGVQSFFHQLQRAGQDTRSLAGIQIAAVGNATAAALNRYGILADLIPENFIADSLAKAILDRSQPGDQILVVRPKEGRNVLARMLQDSGRIVKELITYETLPYDRQPEYLRSRVADGDFDMILFSSPSTVRGFLRLFDPTEWERMQEKSALCIGPVTEKAAREAGFARTMVPEESSTDGIVQFFRNRAF